MVQLKPTNRGPKISFKVGRYFLALSTTDELIERELIDRLSTNPNAELDLGDLPRRKWLHDTLGGSDPVCCGAFRSAAVGINTLVVFFDKDEDNDGESKGFYFFGNPRSGKVATYPYFFNVVPSGMFQPTVFPREPKREFRIKHSFLREYFEELYDAEEVRKSKGRGHANHFYRKGPVKRLLKRLKSNNSKVRAELYFTGLCVNLLTLRPDICTLLLIRDGDWYDEEGSDSRDEDGHIYSIKLSDEYLVDEPSHLKELFDKLGVDKLKIRVPLNERLEVIQPDRLGPHNMLPPAAAFIGLGLRVARQKLGICPKTGR